MKNPKALTSAILLLVAGGLNLALGIRQIVRRNDLSWFSMTAALLFIIAGALQFWAWGHPRKPPGDSPLGILR
jgi:protein-S-isoprenylcysteine O-methyltransferase Ste14